MMYHHELIVGQLDSILFRGCVVLIQFLHCLLLMVYEYESFVHLSLLFIHLFPNSDTLPFSLILTRCFSTQKKN